MENKINRLLVLTYELEGLVRVLNDRDTKELRETLKVKVKALDEVVAEILDETETEVECGAMYVPAEAQHVEPQGYRPVTDRELSSEDEVKDQEAEDGEVEDQMDDALEAIERGENEHLDARFEEEEPAPCLNQNATIGEVCDTVPTTTVVNNPENDDKASQMRIDEKLSRNFASDIKKIFTLNDKFRFRRELFGSNDALFSDTLNMLGVMATYAEACDYLEHQLGWNMKSEEVEDFLSIIKNHYNS